MIRKPGRFSWTTSDWGPFASCLRRPFRRLFRSRSSLTIRRPWGTVRVLWGLCFFPTFFWSISFRDWEVWSREERRNSSFFKVSRMRMGMGRTFQVRKGSGRKRTMLVESFDVWLRVATKPTGQRILLISILSLSTRISGRCWRRRRGLRCLRKSGFRIRNNFYSFYQFQFLIYFY